jgi:hypothetical protein
VQTKPAAKMEISIDRPVTVKKISMHKINTSSKVKKKVLEEIKHFQFLKEKKKKEKRKTKGCV